MARILYGVTGEGLGHAMRSRVVLEHLVAQGHEVAIIASGRAVPFLARRFEGVRSIRGLHMVFDENRVHVLKTLLSNALALGVSGMPHNIAAYFDVVRRFRPEVVISDFESWTYVYAKAHRLPILSIDNMQVIDRCNLPDVAIKGHEFDFRLTRAFIASKLPLCDDYFVTTFFRPPLRLDRTRLLPPILRPEILAATPSDGDHLLVYHSAGGSAELEDALRKTKVECRVYGVRRTIRHDEIDGNLRHRPIDEARFIEDLASCRGVVAGGGFTLMGEAAYLKKPMLAVPIEGQFEQVLNARYLELEGNGRSAESLDDPRTLDEFVAEIPSYRRNLEKRRQAGNDELTRALDEWLDKASVGLG